MWFLTHVDSPVPAGAVHQLTCPVYLLYAVWRSLAAVRSAKFIARKQWMVCGADDMQLRVYNYNTMDKVKTFEAHTDYIRYGCCVSAPM